MTDQSLVPPSRGKAHATAADREGWLGATTREIIFTACCGSVLDFDHFLAAGSLKLSSATRLANRPWGHCMAAVVLAVSEGQTIHYVVVAVVPLWLLLVKKLCHAGLY